MSERPTAECKAFLKSVRARLNAAPEEKIDKRIAETQGGYLAPNDVYYEGHCAYCAEADYLMDIYKEEISRQVDASSVSAGVAKVKLNRAVEISEVITTDDLMVGAIGQSGHPGIKKAIEDLEDAPATVSEAIALVNDEMGIDPIAEVINADPLGLVAGASKAEDDTDGSYKYNETDKDKSEAVIMNLKGFLKACPAVESDPIAKALAEQILSGKTPYAAGKIVGEKNGRSTESLYSRARRVYELIQVEEAGGIEEIVAAIAAGETVDVPELRALSIRNSLKKQDVAVQTASMIRFTLG